VSSVMAARSLRQRRAGNTAAQPMLAVSRALSDAEAWIGAWLVIAMQDHAVTG
jgi:hypothetical protein